MLDLTECEVDTLIGYVGEILGDERNDCLENVYNKLIELRGE